MKRTNPVLAACFLIVALMSVACSSTSIQYAPRPESSAAVGAGMSRFYFMRSQFYGGRQAVRLQNGRKPVARIEDDGYACFEAPSGRYLARAYVERPEYLKGEVEGLLSIDSEPGKVYYVVIELAHEDLKPKMRVVSEKEGTEMLASLTAAEVTSGP
jgi:hypothetical protein